MRQSTILEIIYFETNFDNSRLNQLKTDSSSAWTPPPRGPCMQKVCRIVEAMHDSLPHLSRLLSLKYRPYHKTLTKLHATHTSKIDRLDKELRFGQSLSERGLLELSRAFRSR